MDIDILKNLFIIYRRELISMGKIKKRISVKEILPQIKKNLWLKLIVDQK